MNILARIAQMESSRIVGGRAQTQALLRAPDLTSQRNVGRGRFDRSAGSLGVRQLHADNSISLPPDPHVLSTRALLERGYVAQALIDSTAVLFCFLFVLSVAMSIPLALFLLLFASF